MKCGMRMRISYLTECDPVLLVVNERSAAAAKWQHRRNALLQLAPVHYDVTLSQRNQPIKTLHSTRHPV